MKHIKRFSVIFFAIVLLFSLVPFQAFAVDPVSASVIANAFAQAIASYGASNGVAMTFDVSSTNGIGESVHELWKDFREGQQTVDDYATIAQAIFPELYYKSAVALGTASDAVAVGVHISSTYAETLDEFYNWLLSGPAEMVHVDNQYYEFSASQIGPESSSLPVQYSTILDFPAPVYLNPVANATTYNSGFVVNIGGDRNRSITSNISSTYFFWVDWKLYAVNTSSFTGCVISQNAYSPSSYERTFGYSQQYSSVSQTYYRAVFNFYNSGTRFGAIFPTLEDGIAAYLSVLDGTGVSSVGVKAYDLTGIADFPDTADPNYDALSRSKDIPLNIPWDDALYGDGTGTLTDAQSAAIAGDLSQALVTDRTVELVEEQDIPIQPDYSDVLLPLIPINVPSFNFSLSGIWHYVRSWVTSLGAWLSMMFSVWGILPYAIVVPVYACLVIVIVLGLYKRFFM